MPQPLHADGAPANDAQPGDAPCSPPPTRSGSRYRPWAELMKRTFSLDVLACPSCGGRLRLLALVTDPNSTRRLLRGLGEPTEAPARQPARGTPLLQEPRAAARAGDDDESVA